MQQILTIKCSFNSNGKIPGPQYRVDFDGNRTENSGGFLYEHNILRTLQSLIINTCQ